MWHTGEIFKKIKPMDIVFAQSKYGVRNDLRAVVKKVKKDEVMAQAEFALEGPLGMTCVISRDSMDDLDLKPGDQVRLLVKAINVIPVKD